MSEYPPPWSCQIEPLEGCSRMCPFCGIWGMWRSPKDHEFRYMTPNLASEIASSLRELRNDRGCRVEMALRGEPTLNPKLPEIVSAFRKNFPECQLLVSSNDYVTKFGSDYGFNEDYVYGLFDSGLNYLLIENYDGPSEMANMIKNLRSLREGIIFKEYYEGENVYAYHGNEHRKVVLMDDIASRNREKRTRTIFNHAGNVNFDLASKFGVKKIEKPLERTCTNVFRELAICWDGTVTACCFDGKTNVVCKIKMKLYNDPQILHTDFKHIDYLDSKKSIKKLWVLREGDWVEADFVKTKCKDWYKITMKNGISFVTTFNHLFMIKNSVNGKVIIKFAEELSEKDYLPFSISGYEAMEDLGTYEMGKFVGLYVAEGTDHSTFYYGDNDKEREFVDFTISFIKNVLCGYVRHEYQESRHTNVVSSRSSSVKGFLEDFVKGNKFSSKKLTRKAFLMSKNFRKGLLDGAFGGNGFHSGVKNPITMSMRNPYLVTQLAYMNASLGIPYTMRYGSKHNKNDTFLRICLLPFDNPNDYTLPETKYSFPWVDKYAWCKIKSIEKLGKKNSPINAYCFKVKDGEPIFQLANGFVVHNCMDWNRELVVGKFPEMSLSEIWNGDAFHIVRALLYKKIRSITPCNRCDYPGGFRQGIKTPPPEKFMNLDIESSEKFLWWCQNKMNEYRGKYAEWEIKK